MLSGGACLRCAQPSLFLRLAGLRLISRGFLAVRGAQQQLRQLTRRRSIMGDGDEVAIDGGIMEGVRPEREAKARTGPRGTRWRAPQAEGRV